MQNTIQKSIDLKAPVSRVWRALTDYKEFGEWFRVKIEAPFVAGEVSRGYLTYPGYEHVKWELVIKEIQPERLFSFTWHPYAVEEGVDYSKETPTLVEFTLEEIEGGTTRLTVTESGFDKIPANRRALAFRMNEGGWNEQVKSIRRYVSEQIASATSFLKMVAERKVDEAYDSYISSDFIHHNQYFKGDRESLKSAMEQAGEANPNKQLEIKKVFEDGDTVITFSHVKQNSDDIGGAVIHVFRFENGKVVELWDLGQPINKEVVNENGVF